MASPSRTEDSTISNNNNNNSMTPRGTIVLVTDGSYGDVLPFLAIASRLAQDESNRVFLLCSEHFEDLVHQTHDQIRFISTCSKAFYSSKWGADADKNRNINNLDSLINGAKNMIERQRDIYKLLQTILLDGDTTLESSSSSASSASSASSVASDADADAEADASADVVTTKKIVLMAHPLVSAANIFCEKYATTMDISMITVLLSPIYLRSFEHDFYPSCIMKAHYYFADIILDSVLAGPINKLRDDLNGKSCKIRRVCHDWLLSDTCILALFPTWFVRNKPIQRMANVTKHMGFITPEKNVITSDTNSANTFPEELNIFLEASKKKGLKIVVFTPGSLNPPNATRFFREGKAAIDKLNKGFGERAAAIFLTKYKDVLPDDVSLSGKAVNNNIIHFTFISLSDLLNHCDLCIHHGGIGTLGSCLATSTPSVIVPSAFDQFDNADIVEKLGVGVTVKENCLTSTNLVKAICSLIDFNASNTSASSQSIIVNSKINDFETSRQHKSGVSNKWDIVRSRCAVLGDDINSHTHALDEISSLVAQYLV